MMSRTQLWSKLSCFPLSLNAIAELPAVVMVDNFFPGLYIWLLKAGAHKTLNISTCTSWIAGKALVN